MMQRVLTFLAGVASSSGSKLARLLFTPHASVDDLGEKSRARLLAILSLVFSAALVVAIFSGPSSIPPFVILLVIGGVAYALSRTASYNLGAQVFTFGLTAYAYLSVILGWAQSLETAVTSTVHVALILSSALLTKRGLLVLGIGATIMAFLAPAYVSASAVEGVGRVGGVVLSIAAILYVLNLYRDATEQTRLSDLRTANRSLQEARRELERRVRERTLELSTRTEELAARSAEIETANVGLARRANQFEAISQVARSIASIRDLQSLLPQVTVLISQNFGFYHVGIFLLDEPRENAVLSAANSEGGQRMLARKHSLRVGQEGIVGFVTATGQPRTALDVGSDAVYFNNPDLPQTHSEIALPLKSGDRIVGALDVQSTEPNAFTDEDVQLLSTLADQVSLAIENARLFDETQRSLAEAEAFSRQYLREGWNRLTAEQRLLGYRYGVAGAVPLNQPVKPPEPEAGHNGRVHVPIELRGETIGELVVQAPSGRHWNPDELDLIRAVAERVALSAENARLFEETNRRAERERMVSEITSRIRSTNDPNEMISLAVQELKNALGAHRVEVVPQRLSGSSDAPEK